jgi:hypothetical protein
MANSSLFPALETPHHSIPYSSAHVPIKPPEEEQHQQGNAQSKTREKNPKTIVLIHPFIYCQNQNFSSNKESKPMTSIFFLNSIYQSNANSKHITWHLLSDRV